MNDATRDVVQYLRNKGEFDMGLWRNDCGTVGCIAGTVMIRAGVNNSSTDWARPATYAGKIMGLDTVIANHLFMPGFWVESLLEGYYAEQHEHLWKGNHQCDLSTIEKMRDFAARHLVIYELIGAHEAANAIEFLHDRHPHYVDWREAIEEEIVF